MMNEPGPSRIEMQRLFSHAVRCCCSWIFCHAYGHPIQCNAAPDQSWFCWFSDVATLICFSPLKLTCAQQLTRCHPGGRLHPRAKDDGLLRGRPLPPQISPWRCQGPLPLLGLPGEICQDRRAQAAPLPHAPRQDWAESKSTSWKDQVWGGGIKRVAAGFLKWYVMGVRITVDQCWDWNTFLIPSPHVAISTPWPSHDPHPPLPPHLSWPLTPWPSPSPPSPSRWPTASWRSRRWCTQGRAGASWAAPWTAWQRPLTDVPPAERSSLAVISWSITCVITIQSW